MTGERKEATKVAAVARPAPSSPASFSNHASGSERNTGAKKRRGKLSPSGRGGLFGWEIEDLPSLWNGHSDIFEVPLVGILWVLLFGLCTCVHACVEGWRSQGSGGIGSTCGGGSVLWRCFFCRWMASGQTCSNSSILYFLDFLLTPSASCCFFKINSFHLQIPSDSGTLLCFVLELSVSEWVRPWLCCSKQRIPSTAVARTAARDNNKAACVRTFKLPPAPLLAGRPAT